MAALSRCGCCSLLTGAIVIGIASMILYLLSFGIELWWIMATEDRLPIPAYVLAVGFFFLSLVSLFLLVGLRTRRTRLLLVWMLFFLIFLFPETGMVLFMAIYYWNGGTNGIVELSLWIVRILFNILGIISIHSLYTHWKDEKSVLKSLQDLNLTNGHGVPGEYHKNLEAFANLGYQNHGYSGSNPHLNSYTTMAITKYANNTTPKSIKRSPSSHFVSDTRLSLTSLHPQPRYHSQYLPPSLNASSMASLTGYKNNEFDTSKFVAAGLVHYRSQSQFDLPSFGLDPDDPVFMTGFGQGGLGFHQRARHRRPRQSDRSLQWYRPRSLVNLEDDDLYRVPNEVTLNDGVFTQSLDRRKRRLQERSRSMGSITDFGPSFADHFYQHQKRYIFQSIDSKQSLGQQSDHIDRYRDVAL